MTELTFNPLPGCSSFFIIRPMLWNIHLLCTSSGSSSKIFWGKKYYNV